MPETSPPGKETTTSVTRADVRHEILSNDRPMLSSCGKDLCSARIEETKETGKEHPTPLSRTDHGIPSAVNHGMCIPRPENTVPVKLTPCSLGMSNVPLILSCGAKDLCSSRTPLTSESGKEQGKSVSTPDHSISKTVSHGIPTPRTEDTAVGKLTPCSFVWANNPPMISCGGKDLCNNSFGSLKTGASSGMWRQTISFVSRPCMDQNASVHVKATDATDSILSSVRVTGEPSSATTNELEIVSSCDCNRLSSLFGSLNNEKAKILKSFGFDGLLKLPVLEKLDDTLSLWLYNRYDPLEGCLNLDGGYKLTLRDLDVHLIFGIPFQGQDVQYSQLQHDDIVQAFNYKIGGKTDLSSLSMAFLEQILSQECTTESTQAQVDAFKIAVVLCSISYLLAPEQGNSFPGALIRNFLPDVKPAEFNWARFVMFRLGEAASIAQEQFRACKKKILLYGCPLLLQVFYLDNMNFGPCTPYHIQLPRASAYSQKMLKELAESDCRGSRNTPLLQFGSRPVREAFEVCYTRGYGYHNNLHTCPQSPEDLLDNIRIISEGLNVLEQFDSLVHQLKLSSNSIPLPSYQSARDSYHQVKSKFSAHIHDLSSKAASMLKRRFMTMNRTSYLAAESSTTRKRASIAFEASSNQMVMKRTRPLGNTSGDRVLVRAMEGVPIQQVLPQILGFGQHYPWNTCSPQPVEFQRHPPNSISLEGSSTEMTIPDLPKWKLISNHSKFPASMFDLSLNHPDVAKTLKTRSYAWLTGQLFRQDELNREWVLLYTPAEIKLTGNVVRDCLQQLGAFTVPLVDAIMYVWKYLDDKVYDHIRSLGQSHNRWRHFLPASFAVAVLNGSDYLKSDVIRSAFIGRQIGYEVANCQKFILPVLIDATWSCYVWDFKAKTATVLDPLLMGSEPTRAKFKHQAVVVRLHKALLSCIQNFFLGWDISDIGWTQVFRCDLGHKCRLPNSGLYAVHYCRSSCDDQLVFELQEAKDANLSEARGEVIYHLFTCPDNEGYKPPNLMNEIGRPLS